MDDTKTQAEEIKEDKVEETPTDVTSIVAEEAPVSEISEPEKTEEPEKVEEIEAPKEELVEAKEEDGKAESEPLEEEVAEEPKPATPKDNAKWYIVHTYSGHENKVAKSLKQRIESMGFENRIFDIIVPTRETVKVSQGKKETVKEKIKNEASKL